MLALSESRNPYNLWNVNPVCGRRAGRRAECEVGDLPHRSGGLYVCMCMYAKEDWLNDTEALEEARRDAGVRQLRAPPVGVGRKFSPGLI